MAGVQGSALATAVSEAGALGALRAAAEASGSAEFTPLWAGQNAHFCREVPAAEIVAELARGVPAALRGRRPERSTGRAGADPGTSR
jgi:hypothetical protein